MIVTRREFLKWTGAVAAGLAVKRTWVPGLYRTTECRLDPATSLYVQELRPGESILGPIRMFDFTLCTDQENGVNGRDATIRRRGDENALFKYIVSPGCTVRWVATPENQVIVPPQKELIFESTDKLARAFIYFDKFPTWPNQGKATPMVKP